jgi:hypothetical protein
MQVTLHCLDCGFRFSITVPGREATGPVLESLSCGHCGSHRWVAS